MNISITTARTCLDLLSLVQFRPTDDGVDANWALARQSVEELREYIKHITTVDSASRGASGSDNSNVVP